MAGLKGTSKNTFPDSTGYKDRWWRCTQSQYFAEYRSFARLALGLFARSHYRKSIFRGALKYFLAAGLAVGVLFGCKEKSGHSDSAKPNPILQVFAAASLIDVMGEIAPLFEKKFGVKPKFNFAGSQTLARQISNSLGADVFLSANEFWMDEVELLGRIVEGSRKKFISNSIGLIAAFPFEGPSLAAAGEFCNLSFEALILGDPNNVPAGKYAKAWMENLACGQVSSWEKHKDKLVPTQDVRQALNLIREKEGAVGVVYGSDIFSAEGIKILFQPPLNTYPSISYAGAVVKKNSPLSAASQFLDFLLTPEAQAVFVKYGFRSLFESPKS